MLKRPLRWGFDTQWIMIGEAIYECPADTDILECSMLGLDNVFWKLFRCMLPLYSPPESLCLQHNKVPFKCCCWKWPTKTDERKRIHGKLPLRQQDHTSGAQHHLCFCGCREICFCPWILKFSAHLLWLTTAVLRAWAAGITSGDAEAAHHQGGRKGLVHLWNTSILSLKLRASPLPELAGAELACLMTVLEQTLAVLARMLGCWVGNSPTTTCKWKPESAWNAAGKCRSPEGAWKSWKGKKWLRSDWRCIGEWMGWDVRLRLWDWDCKTCAFPNLFLSLLLNKTHWPHKMLFLNYMQ